MIWHIYRASKTAHTDKVFCPTNTFHHWFNDYFFQRSLRNWKNMHWFIYCTYTWRWVKKNDFNHSSPGAADTWHFAGAQWKQSRAHSWSSWLCAAHHRVRKCVDIHIYSIDGRHRSQKVRCVFFLSLLEHKWMHCVWRCGKDAMRDSGFNTRQCVRKYIYMYIHILMKCISLERELSDVQRCILWRRTKAT